jgi:hypothetical protein
MKASIGPVPDRRRSELPRPQLKTAIWSSGARPEAPGFGDRRPGPVDAAADRSAGPVTDVGLFGQPPPRVRVTIRKATDGQVPAQQKLAKTWPAKGTVLESLAYAFPAATPPHGRDPVRAKSRS